MKEKFEIINASAGSGKTFTLSSKVIQRILSGKDDNFKKVLALTFTNNSANDMKNRILDELRQISIDPLKSIIFQSSPLKESFSNTQISKKAAKMLNKILHNFSFFQVSTIDKFNHRLIRTFSNDLSISYDFDLIIEKDEFTDELIKKFIDNLKKDSFLTQTIINHSTSKHSENKTWDISYDLKDLLNIVWDENNYKYLSAQKMDKDDFQNLRNKLKSKKIIFLKKTQKLSSKIEKFINSQDINRKCFSYNALPNFLNQINSVDLKKVDYTSLEKRLSSNKLIKKDFIDSSSQKLIEIITPLLSEVFITISKYKVYTNLFDNTTLNYLINNIAAFSKEFQKENNTLLISDFNSIISENISDQPAPFIYEKIGNKYNNYFIDEFQDTSELQWKNLIPLTSHSILNEELDEDGGNLFIVGDPKQSIYRWRGAKPETFTDLSNSNPFYITPSINNLGKNFRSFSNIVDFNNKLFSHISDQSALSNVKSIYSGLSQDYKDDKKGGYISIKLIKTSSKIDYEIESYQRVIEIIRDKQKQGFNLSDIAILCRTNKECNSLSSFLINQEIKVNSEELLALSSSKEVLFIIDLIRLRLNENNLESKKSLLKFISIKKNLKNKHKFISENMLLNIKIIFKKILKIDYDFFFELDLYQSTQYVISTMDLFKSAIMQVHFLLEEIFEFSNSKLSNKQSFIDYWEIKKEKLKVNLIEENNAIRVLTIHKSKGLEFPIVILPFFDFKLYKSDKKIWANFNEDDFKGTYLVDHDQSLSLFNSEINNNIQHQNNQMFLEGVNTMYVSLSRAILENHLISKQSEPSESISSGLLLNSFLDKDSNLKEKTFFEIGKKCPKGNLFNNPEKKLKQIKNSRTNKKFNKINYYFSSNNKSSSKFGNLFHKIMSEIEYDFQIEPVINDFYERGIINNMQSESIKSYSKLITTHKQLRSFFNKNNVVYNEREILIPPNEVIIPDKTVFLGGNSISILDYKTGTKKNAHEDQMKKYILNLEKAKYRVKNAFLVYVVDKINIVEVRV